MCRSARQQQLYSPTYLLCFTDAVLFLAAVLQIAFLGVKLAWHFAAQSLEGAQATDAAPAESSHSPLLDFYVCLQLTCQRVLTPSAAAAPNITSRRPICIVVLMLAVIPDTNSRDIAMASNASSNQQQMLLVLHQSMT
jgi:hypothetical protein